MKEKSKRFFNSLKNNYKLYNKSDGSEKFFTGIQIMTKNIHFEQAINLFLKNLYFLWKKSSFRYAIYMGITQCKTVLNSIFSFQKYFQRLKVRSDRMLATDSVDCLEERIKSMKDTSNSFF